MNFTRLRATLWRFRFFLAAAAILAVLASALSTLRGMKPQTVGVVVASRDLPPGTELTSGDLRVAEVPRALVPAETQSSPGDFDGKILVTPLPEGMPLGTRMLLSEEFLSSVEPGQVVVPITVRTDGLEALLKPGLRVALYAPRGEYAQSQEAITVVPRATIVGLGPVSRTSSFSNDSSNTRPLFLAVPRNAASLVIGYGSTTPMRVVIVK